MDTETKIMFKQVLQAISHTETQIHQRFDTIEQRFEKQFHTLNESFLLINLTVAAVQSHEQPPLNFYLMPVLTKSI